MKLQASARNFIEKDTPTQIFSCKAYEVFQNTFSTDDLGGSIAESSSQTICLDIIINDQKDINCGNIDYIANFENVFRLGRLFWKPPSKTSLRNLGHFQEKYLWWSSTVN